MLQCMYFEKGFHGFLNIQNTGGPSSKFSPSKKGVWEHGLVVNVMKCMKAYDDAIFIGKTFSNKRYIIS